ncbi:hypothetical protein ABZ079_07550 [Streptomyces sp. NPDC006314]|uniref:hypothetical protein n=1 Tax=Streptomyces sp. NPDC006314 TaxID=3154475 RepID=UPI0033A42EAB
MAAPGPALPLGTVAAAALAVPGVAGLQPGLVHRLAAATAPTGSDPTGHRTAPQAGVHAERAPDGSGWHIEVRCVLTEGRGVLDTAREVHDRVRAAVLPHLAAPDALAATGVTVTVTVTGIAAGSRSA